MRAKSVPWLWIVLWAMSILVAASLALIYAWLPADGMTGDLESFTPQGFRVQWVLEGREGGLRVDDVIVRGGGHTVDEWLDGAPRGPQWRDGGTVLYEVLRDGQMTTVDVRLAPVRLASVARRWALQLAVGAAFLLIGTFVFLKRMRDLAAQLLMLFCVATALQFWGDGFNFQYAILPWRWPLWFHFLYENATYSLSVSSMCYFALVFPLKNPILKRLPRLVPFLLYAFPPVVIAGAMLVPAGWSQVLRQGNLVAWSVAVVEIAIAIGAGFHSMYTARDPVSRAQVRWILWCAGVGCVTLVPGYVVPLIIRVPPLLPHPLMMIFIVLIPLTFAVDILRFRLFDIEIIINRTLVYGVLTTLLTGLYLLLVRVLTVVVEGVLHRPDDTLVVFIPALSIALAFAPLRRRVQLVIDRTFYRTKLDYQRLLPEMSERISSSIVLDQLADALTTELPRRLQITRADLLVLDAEGDTFVVAGRTDGAIASHHPIVAALRRASPLVRLALPAELEGEVLAFLEEGGIELSIPLAVGAELVGIYNLGRKLSADAYVREEVRLLQIVGRQAAIAVQNSRLFEAERTQRELAQALDEAASVVGSTLELDQVLDRILEQVERVVKGDAFSILLIEGDEARIVRGRGYERVGLGNGPMNAPIRVSLDRTLTEIRRTRKPVFASEAGEDGDPAPRRGWEWRRSFVAAPIQIGEAVIGALSVDGTRPGQFGPRDASRLEAFTHHAAAAISNARLYENAQQEIAERRRTEERIVASLREKEVLLKEVHHRVKNNLQVISSLLYLQSISVEDSEVRDAFEDSQTRVRSMALVHEKLYQSADLARIDFAEYVRSLADILATSGVGSPRIDVIVSIEGIALNVDTAIPCGLILNELIFNSMKHAFRGRASGEIHISIRAEPPGTLVMTVVDNGIGLPGDLDFRKTKSLGLQLVNTLVSQLEGNIELERGEGTGFRISFPDPSVETTS